MGNKAMNKAERSHVTEAKLGRCMPCLSWAQQGRMPLAHVAEGVSYDHKKRGNLRIGHMSGFGSCAWHHFGHPGNGWTAKAMREHFGPSLMDGGKLFTAAYGSDAELIALQASQA
jgi:hypothetical protein